MAIKNFSWVLPGKLAGTALPGGYHPNIREYVAADLLELAGFGITCIVSLERVADFFPAVCADAHLEWTPFYLPDFGVPGDEREFRGLIRKVIGSMEAGAIICAHCRAGIGRTGMFLSCMVGEYLSLSAEAAVRAVRKTRLALETPGQEAFVRNYLREHGGL